MGEVWKRFCDERLGALVVNSPALRCCYTYRASHRDVYFAYLWKTLCDIAGNPEQIKIAAIERAMFHVPHSCLLKHCTGIFLNTHIYEACREELVHNQGQYDHRTNATCITADFCVSYITGLINLMTHTCHVRPGVLYINNWDVIDGQMRHNHDTFKYLLSEVEALVIQFNPLSTESILQDLVCDTTYTIGHRAQMLPLYKQHFTTQTLHRDRYVDIVKILFQTKKSNVVLYAEGPFLFSVINVAKLTELSLLLDDFELIDTQLNQLSMLIAEICNQHMIETLHISVSLRQQHALEWCASPHCMFLESSLLSLPQQKQLKALLLSGLISNIFARSLIVQFLSTFCCCRQILRIGRTTQVGELDKTHFSSRQCNVTDEFMKHKTIELHYCSAGLLTWLLSSSNLYLGQLAVHDDIENLIKFTATSFHVDVFTLMLTSHRSVQSNVHCAIGSLFSSIISSPCLLSFTVAMHHSVPSEICCFILDAFSSTVFTGTTCTSLQQLNLCMECDEVSDTTMKNISDALFSLPNLENMNIIFHCQCAEQCHFDIFRNSLMIRKPFAFHFCSFNTVFNALS